MPPAEVANCLSEREMTSTDEELVAPAEVAICLSEGEVTSTEEELLAPAEVAICLSAECEMTSTEEELVAPAEVAIYLSEGELTSTDEEMVAPAEVAITDAAVTPPATAPWLSDEQAGFAATLTSSLSAEIMLLYVPSTPRETELLELADEATIDAKGMRRVSSVKDVQRVWLHKELDV